MREMAWGAWLPIVSAGFMAPVAQPAPAVRAPAPAMRVRPAGPRVFDVVVVGGGPVGVKGALHASTLGLHALLIDATPPQQFQLTGPTGLFSKALRDAALKVDVAVLRQMGIGDSAIWSQVREQVDTTMRKAGANNMAALTFARVPHLRGAGSLVPAAELAADERAPKARCAVDVAFSQRVGGRKDGGRVYCDQVLLATGSRAVRLPCVGGAYAEDDAEPRVFHSDSIKRLSYLPRSIAIVGGGIIAVEFARIFAELNAEVTLLVRARDLPSSLERVGIDRELGLALQADLLGAGISLRFETELDGVDVPTPSVGARSADCAERPPVGLRLRTNDGAGGASTSRMDVDALLTATGRSACAAELNLDAAGVATAPNGDVVVDARLQTRAAGVYAAGDLIGAPQLASTGIAQAEAAVEAMLRDEMGATYAIDELLVAQEGTAPANLLADAARFPIGIWTIPEVAFVGLTADRARAPPHELAVVEGARAPPMRCCCAP